MGYSTQQEISDFIGQLGPFPLIVSDMDGNTLRGYKHRDGGTMNLGEGDDPAIQSIPYTLPVSDLEMFVEQGLLQHAIFAKKRMDVRLSEEMAAMINEQIARGLPFRTAFLTSRGEADTFKILRASGVIHPEKLTIATDSGAILWIHGKRHMLTEPTESENNYLAHIDGIAKWMQPDIDRLVRLYVPGFRGEMPDLVVEKKKIATNVHWREILDKTGQAEGSPLDDAISAHVKKSLEIYSESAIGEGHEPGTFMTLDGPMTVEFKLSRINKALGLEAIMKAALKAPEHQRPTSIVFTGDDIANKKGGPGTDWFAMNGITTLGHKHGIATFNIHTHHPEGELLDSTQPDPNKSPERLSAQWPKPPIHLVVPTPIALEGVIMRIEGVRHLWDSEAPLDLGIHHV